MLHCWWMRNFVPVINAASDVSTSSTATTTITTNTRSGRKSSSIDVTKPKQQRHCHHDLFIMMYYMLINIVAIIIIGSSSSSNNNNNYAIAMVTAPTVTKTTTSCMSRSKMLTIPISSACRYLAITTTPSFVGRRRFLTSRRNVNANDDTNDTNTSAPAVTPQNSEREKREAIVDDINATKQQSNTATTFASQQRPAFGQVAHRPKQFINNKQPAVTKVSSQTDKQSTSSISSERRRSLPTTARGDRNEVINNNSDGTISSLHTSRIQNAGRIGTKRYRNPCKVYFGNLSYQIQDKQVLQDFVIQQIGLPSHIIIRECNVVVDWKTNQSKGYGFVVFTEPIYATVAITKLHGMTWYNRTITVSQGVQKQNVEELETIYRNAYMKKQIRQQHELQQTENPIPEPEEIIYMDAKEAALLKHLDPDLLRGVQIIKSSSSDIKPTESETEKQNKKSHATIETADTDDDDDDDSDASISIEDDNDIEHDYDDDDTEVFVDDFDSADDAMFLNEDDDDTEYDYDYETEIDNDNSNNSDTNEEATTGTKNRQQRRDDAKGKKKVKLPRKGFG